MRRVLLLMILTVSVLLTACGKPVITEECVMNGMGDGTCSFTNTGGSDGTICGTIVVVRSSNIYPDFKSDRAESSNFCSGVISPDTTNRIGFNVPRTNKMCSGNHLLSWNEACDFTFSSSSVSSAAWIRNLLILILAIVSGGLIWRYFPMLKGLYEKNTRKCPFCAESVKPQAIICKSCGKDIHEQVVAQNVGDQSDQKSAEINVDGKNLFAAKLGAIKLWLKQQSIGSRLILASLLIAIVSMFMDWFVSVDLGGLTEVEGSSFIDWIEKISIGFCLFICCWRYPIVMLLKNKSIKLWIGLVGSSISLLWSALIIRIVLNSPGFKVGFGVWVYVLASIVLLGGVLASRQARQSVV